MEELSNNELVQLIKTLETEHETLKLKMLSDFDKMTQIEIEHKKAQTIIDKRQRKR